MIVASKRTTNGDKTSDCTEHRKSHWNYKPKRFVILDVQMFALENYVKITEQMQIKIWYYIDYSLE